jgi:hypothetical protein
MDESVKNGGKTHQENIFTSLRLHCVWLTSRRCRDVRGAIGSTKRGPTVDPTFGYSNPFSGYQTNAEMEQFLGNYLFETK